MEKSDEIIDSIKKVVHAKDGRIYRRYILIVYSSLVLIMIYAAIPPSSLFFYGWIFPEVSDGQTWKVTKVILSILLGLHFIDVVPIYLGRRADKHKTSTKESGSFYDLEERLELERQVGPYPEHLENMQERDEESHGFDGDYKKYLFHIKLEGGFKKLEALWQSFIVILYESGLSLGLGVFALSCIMLCDTLPISIPVQKSVQLEPSEITPLHNTSKSVTESSSNSENKVSVQAPVNISPESCIVSSDLEVEACEKASVDLCEGNAEASECDVEHSGIPLQERPDSNDVED